MGDRLGIPGAVGFFSIELWGGCYTGEKNNRKSWWEKKYYRDFMDKEPLKGKYRAHNLRHEIYDHKDI